MVGAVFSVFQFAGGLFPHHSWDFFWDVVLLGQDKARHAVWTLFQGQETCPEKFASPLVAASLKTKNRF